MLACLLKQPKYHEYVLKKTISHNLMTNKMQTLLITFTQGLLQIKPKNFQQGKKIFRGNSVGKYYSVMNIPSNSFKFRNAKRKEIYKILINIDPNKAYGFDEVPKRFLYWQKHCVKLSTFS